MKTVAELLGIKYPIFQGGMTKIATSELVSAVSNAGGLGILASAGLSAEELREEIRKTKEKTNNPFAVNLMLMNKNIAELIDVIIAEGITIVTTGAGTPKPYMEKFLEHSIKVIPVIPNAKIAKKMQDLGVTAVIAEGMESGGHIGEATTMALIPQVVDAVDIPVIAAGGIADGRGLAAVFALGAQGVQIGTMFLATEECPIPQSLKEKIVSATDSDTIVLSRYKGIPFRSLKNEFTNNYATVEMSSGEVEELNKLKLEGLEKALEQGDTDNGVIFAGQVAGLVKEIKPVADVIVELFISYNKILKNLTHIEIV